MTYVTVGAKILCCPPVGWAEDCRMFHKKLMELDLIGGLGCRFKAS